MQGGDAGGEARVKNLNENVRSTRALKITLAYDGTRFVGWQRQSEGESIQALLEDALAHFEGAPVVVSGAGRTDAGVHALGQVASVELTAAHGPATLLRALNAHLPPEIRVLGVDEAPHGFNARFDARGKTYRYVIRNQPVASPFSRAYEWHLPEPLDVDAMCDAARDLIGAHDFSAFQSVGTAPATSVRTIRRADWRSGDGVLTFEIDGDGFLRHMVRAIVGTLVDIGRGWRPADSIPALLQTRRRSAAGATAPPHGLFLVSVDYDLPSRPAAE